jgi:hypothetical protein
MEIRPFVTKIKNLKTMWVTVEKGCDMLSIAALYHLRFNIEKNATFDNLSCHSSWERGFSNIGYNIVVLIPVTFPSQM